MLFCSIVQANDAFTLLSYGSFVCIVFAGVAEETTADRRCKCSVEHCARHAHLVGNATMCTIDCEYAEQKWSFGVRRCCCRCRMRFIASILPISCIHRAQSDVAHHANNQEKKSRYDRYRHLCRHASAELTTTAYYRAALTSVLSFHPNRLRLRCTIMWTIVITIILSVPWSIAAFLVAGMCMLPLVIPLWAGHVKRYGVFYDWNEHLFRSGWQVRVHRSTLDLLQFSRSHVSPEIVQCIISLMFSLARTHSSKESLIIHRIKYCIFYYRINEQSTETALKSPNSR